MQKNAWTEKKRYKEILKQLKLRRECSDKKKTLDQES